MGKYYHTKASVDEYIKQARGHNGRYAIMKLRKYLPDGSSLLELGSGPGTDWQILQQYYKITGSDNSAEFLKYLRANFEEGEFLLLDASSLNIPSRFDAIYSNKVLHHLEDKSLEASIQRQWKHLNPGGVVCHTFWNGEDSEIYNDLFVNYHTESGIRILFGNYFDPLAIRFYKEFEKGDSILYIGKKKEPE